MSELDATSSCLYLANYDIEKALHYYWNEDYKIVQEAVKVKSSHESQQTLSQLEACMYGFGGKYQDDVNHQDIQAVMSGLGGS